MSSFDERDIIKALLQQTLAAMDGTRLAYFENATLQDTNMLFLTTFTVFIWTTLQEIRMTSRWKRGSTWMFAEDFGGNI